MSGFYSKVPLLKTNAYMFKHKKRFGALFIVVLVLCVGLNIYYSTLLSPEKTEPVTIRTWWPRFSWTWFIRNVTDIPKENGYELKSSQFSTERHPNLKWYLSFYPYGDAEDTRGYVGLFLHFASDSEDIVYARCALSIRDFSGRVLNILSFDRGFSKKSDRYGYARFLRTRNLLTAINDTVVEIQVDLSIKTNGSESEYEAEQDQCFYQNTFMQDFSAFQYKNKLNDITIKANNGRSFYRHKAILAARSRVFRERIHSNPTKLSMDLNFSSYTVSLLLDAIYGEKISFSFRSDYDIMNLLKAAHVYDLRDLEESCAAHLDTLMNLSNVADILLLADECNARILRSDAIDFIHKNFRKFMGQYFKSIDNKNKKRLNELLRDIFEHDQAL